MTLVEKAECVKVGLNAGVIIFSILAGGAWLRSALAKVKADDKDGGFTMTVGDEGVEIIVDGVDVKATMALQSQWNTWAAASACVAAFFQALQALPWTKIIV